ncbi:hypothetical protein NKJ93_02110 [Mesorhizobium sp. M0028]|uniref:hypothetical protein n=1 Tax=Mesorhizobium sp. M0028 TaxID=2956849 RepID=UPI0033370B2E
MSDTLIERLEKAQTDVWAHTRIDCLRDAVVAVKERDNLEAVLYAKPTGTAAQRERQWAKRVAALEAENARLVKERDCVLDERNQALGLALAAEAEREALREALARQDSLSGRGGE